MIIHEFDSTSNSELELINQQKPKHALPRQLQLLLEHIRKDGILDLFIREVEKREFMRQPVFRIAVALSVLSASIGRIVRLNCEAMPNLYMLLTAPTGEGKDAARKLANILMEKTAPAMRSEDNQIEPDLVTNWPHSGSALMRLLQEKPERLILVDEIGGFIQAGNANNNGNQSQLVTILTTLFTHGIGPFAVQAYADGNRHANAIPNPWVGLLAFTAPRKLIDALTRESLEDGYLPRNLLFPGSESPELCYPDDGYRFDELPEPLVRQTAEWRKIPREDSTVWAISQEATAFLKNQRELWLERKRSMYSQGLAEAGLYTRCAEIAKRLAIVLAADQLERPKKEHSISLSDMQVACGIVDWSVENFARLCQQQLADSGIGRAENALIDYFRKSPDDWHSLETIRKACRRRELDNASTRNTILEDLAKRGILDRDDKLVNGRLFPIYRLAKS